MTPRSFDGFFGASAGVAGALIGLLFVAISVAGERLTSDHAHRLRASAALTAFANALTVALFALIPGVGLRWPAFAVGVAGLLFVLASLLSIVRVRKVQPVAARDTLFLGGLLVTFAFQLSCSVQLISNARNVGAARGVAILVVVCFLIGIARSWELIGGPSIGFRGEIFALIRARRRED
jgi:hypothetical protein